MRPGKVNSIMSRFPVSVLVILAESSLDAVVEQVNVISDIMGKTLPYHLLLLYVFYTEREGLEDLMKSLYIGNVLAIINVLNFYF